MSRDKRKEECDGERRVLGFRGHFPSHLLESSLQHFRNAAKAVKLTRYALGKFRDRHRLSSS
jgi:hypothetical protein